MVSLGEGGTPCRNSKKIGKNLGLKKLFFKDETHNPTNSFKDRAAALLISHARSWNYHKVICASNGNQGASIAAYTSLEGMECINILPEKIDIGKKAQMIAYNSKLLIKGKIVDDSILESLNPKYKEDFYQCTPEFNPLTLEGQKTISFEIFLEKGVPDWMIIPMGSGGCLVSIWKGFLELKQCNLIKSIPRLVGVQSQIHSPIVNGFHNKISKSVKDEEIIKSGAIGIMVKKPLYKKLAIRAIKESKGTALEIPENLMLSSIEDLARTEGIFAEPASALTIAALNILNQNGIIDSNESVLCLITGSGLKAPYVLEALSSRVKTAGRGPILSTKLKILSQISISNKGIHGSKIKKLIGSVSLPAIYQHLKELEAKNLISRKKEGKNVFYFITKDGKKALEALNTLINLL
ncbi:MAG: pyridoxal-phosphate dependent enzyme [Promethearchaeota archaeon]